MSDIQSFEDRFARRLRSYAEGGSIALDGNTVARFVASGVVTRRRTRAKPWSWAAAAIRPSAFARPAAIGGVALIAVIGVATWIGGVRFTSPADTSAPSASVWGTQMPTASPTPGTLPSPSPEVALGWPGAGANGPGLYSWDGGGCARGFCSAGFMHNATNGGSGDVAITINLVPDDPIAVGARAVTIAGHSGWYRRVVEPEPSFVIEILDLKGYEEWIVPIDGVVVAIRLYARPDTSDADLGDAHAIIDSLRYEPGGRVASGFRLIFRLTNDEWDSG